MFAAKKFIKETLYFIRSAFRDSVLFGLIALVAVLLTTGTHLICYVYFITGWMYLVYLDIPDTIEVPNFWLGFAATHVAMVLHIYQIQTYCKDIYKGIVRFE